MRERLAPRLAPLLALGTLILLFAWIYGRFAPALHFVLDDPIETEVALARPWLAAVTGSFTGEINWSGYRPLTYVLRATLAHLFGTRQMAGYYFVSLGLHLFNTLLTWRVVRRVARNEAWAFLAAAIVLLLPAHNEAVLYMSASANLLALCFCLLTLEFALTARRSTRLWPQIAAALCLALAALAYEVTLPLIVLVAAADWAIDRAAVGAGGAPTLRRRLPMYALMGAAILLVLGLRLWAGNGTVTPDRADYALSLNPLHAARGYLLLLGQMLLLHTSPWPHVPLFANVREWMAPTNPRALASMALALVLGTATLLVGLRAARRADASHNEWSPRPPVWLIWGILWILLMALSFAMLAGRNPENRYTYIPSFGMAVAVAALGAWLLPRERVRPVIQGVIVAASVALLTFYAYVDTSDVAEWERASSHARSFLAAASAVLPAPPLPAEGITLAQVGVPGDVGTAYVFNTQEGFAAAMRLHYGVAALNTLAGDLPLRTHLLNNPEAAEQTILMGYDANAKTVRAVDNALICSAPEQCTRFALLPTATDGPTWTYALVGDRGEPQAAAIALLMDPRQAQPSACWLVFDLAQTQINPRTYDNAAVASRCISTMAALHNAGALDALEPLP